MTRMVKRSPPPMNTPMQPRPTNLLNHSHNVNIFGGEFIEYNNANLSTTSVGFDRLQDQVSARAFYNTSQPFERPKCHANTRTAVLNTILDWILQRETRKTWIMWMNGAAGAGKTAIAQSVAELCIERGILVATYFFFRADPTRNTIKSVVATMAYQLIQLLPTTKNTITQVIESDPLIFTQSLETQLRRLIIEPLNQAHRQNHVTPGTLCLIFDGLDECANTDESQAILIRALVKQITESGLPLIVLISSRAEYQLTMTFRSPMVDRLLSRLVLDDNYLPEDDIRRFLNETFRDLRGTHPFRESISANWPSQADVERVVAMSSGQFIYASVVTKFVSAPHFHPPDRLQVILDRELRHSSLSTPFAELDTLYSYIFSQIDDLELTMRILAYAILADTTFLPFIAFFFDIPATSIRTALAALASVVTCRRNDIQFLHASLPDFLLDKSRSQAYHIDAAEWSTRFCIAWFGKLSTRQVEGWDLSTLINLISSAQGSEELRQAFLRFDPYNAKPLAPLYMEYLTAVKGLDLNDGGETFLRQYASILHLVEHDLPEEVQSLMASFHAGKPVEAGAGVAPRNVEPANVHDPMLGRGQGPPLQFDKDNYITKAFQSLQDFAGSQDIPVLTFE